MSEISSTHAPFVPSSNIAQLKESATIAVSMRAKALRAEGRNIIDLGAGEPDFDTPEFIRRAAARAIDAGATRYTATEGILPLRQAIASQANAIYTGEDAIGAADVVVSTGSKQSLFNAVFVLFGEGDEVLIPTPSWTSYYEMVALARATAVPVYGAREHDLKVTVADLEAAATPRTRGVMLNSPCNPTGAVYDRAELEAILSLADDRGWWVISDEIYQRICYDGVAPSMLDVARGRDRLIVVNGVAKAYAMTGWRIGWAIAPRAVAKAMTALQSHTTHNAAAGSQHGALAALTDLDAADAAVHAMVAEFHARRDAVVREVRQEPGLAFVEPAGAFYLYMNVAGAVRDSADAGTAFAKQLLERHDVAIVPGAAFLTPEWVRMSYAAPMDQVVTGARRIVQAFRELRG
ncbi:MAG TPA: pyridoxal phosphate-dependent aminotransferase [Gemmatimonadaceae bacterium]|nr:pyridoxal phosphate-dependent aminotransferase [Gemmatimonadaceae bacterium]